MEITQALNDPETTCQVVVTYTGINRLATPSSRDLSDLQTEVNDASDILSIVELNQADLHRSLVAGVLGDPITLAVGLRYWGKSDGPFQSFYGQVNGQEIGDWWDRYRSRLFDRNLRNSLGDTEVNAEIRRTIEKDPENFWYFNNGITLVCRKATKTMAGGADRDNGTFHCEDISIVNGAQTVACIGRYAVANPNGNAGKVFVPLRIIALGEHRDFGDRVTRANNRQNKIENRDFVRQDPEQIRIQRELAIDKIEYFLMRSDSTTSSVSNSIDLVESTTALACASGDVKLVVQLKREIGKLWEDLNRGPYKELFNQTIPGLYVWRCVRAQRMVDQRIAQIAQAQAAAKGGRAVGVAVHGNRMISAKALKLLGANRFSDPKFDFDGQITSTLVDQAVDQAFCDLNSKVAATYGNAILPTLFKNQAKCKDLL